MKKTILFALVAMLVAVSCNDKKASESVEKKPEPVKIQSEFLGVELGKTTVDEAKECLKGYKSEYRESVLVIEKPEFAGIEFSSAGFIFEDEVAQQVVFMLFEKEAKGNMDVIFSDLTQRLAKKYGDPKEGKIKGDVVYTWGDDSKTIELTALEDAEKTIRLWYKNTPLNADDDL